MNPDRRWTPVQKRVGILTVLLALSAPGLSALQQPGARRSAEMTEPGSGPLDNEQKIALMTGNELQKIRSRQQRIEQLPEAAQARLRSIHQQWLAHPRRDELLQTMKAYYEWWKTLSVEERARVKSETGPARLQVVKNIIQERAEAVFGIAGETRLPREDVTRLFEWNREFVISKRDQLIELYRSRESRRGSRRLDQMLEQTRQQPETLFWLLYRLRDDQAVQLIEPGDIESLRAKLSSEAVAIIDAQNDEAARQKLVYRWLISAVSAQWNPPIPERELMEFYDLEMTQKQRQMVDAMSPERRRSAIAQMYRARLRTQTGRGLLPFGPTIDPSPNTADPGPPR